MSKDAALECLRGNVKRFEDQAIQKAFSTWKKTVQYRFSDLGECWHIRVDSGRAELREGAVEKPDVEWELTTESLVKLATGELGGMTAFASGAVKVKGSVTDMMKWRKVSNVK